jgi:antitoxin ParD1/3/4
LTNFAIERSLARMATMNISLPDEMRAFVEAQVASGEFANVSDYIRNLIRYDQRELDIVRAAIDEGDASGPSARSIDEIIEDELQALRRA